VEPSKNLFIPVTAQELKDRGWTETDFIFVTGDAYVDHSSFAAALLCRVLENAGYKTGIIAQPDWKNPVQAPWIPWYRITPQTINQDPGMSMHTAEKPDTAPTEPS